MSILRNCLLLTCCLVGCGQREPSQESVHLDGYGEIVLAGGRWEERTDAAEAKRCVKSITNWHKEEVFDTFRVMVFPEHDLVKSIKNGPVIMVRPEGLPEMIFWVPLKNKGRKILIEDTATGEMRLVAPPQGETLDLEFANPKE